MIHPTDECPQAREQVAHAIGAQPQNIVRTSGVTESNNLPDSAGIVQPDQVRDVLRKETMLVLLMHVHNETGVIQSEDALARSC